MAQKSAVPLPATLEDAKKLSLPEMRRLLADLRANPVRRPALVFQCGQTLLREYQRTLGDEVWALQEQVLVAALDLNKIKAAETAWQALANRFSKESNRVRRLQGLILEAQGDYDAAEQLYTDLLEATNNCDRVAHKRRVAVAKARGQRATAVTRLEEYLAIYKVDEEAFHELADLHLKECDYGKATFCFEELVLGDPQNYLFMLKLAECLYSMGEKGNMLDARKYFCQSIMLNQSVHNLRAYYGLWICCITLAGQHGLKDNADNNDLLAWVAAKLRNLYRQHAESAVPRVTLLLKDNNPVAKS